MATEIMYMECSDCQTGYYAEVHGVEIGRKVDKPAGDAKIRTQRMLCGDCHGKGGGGDMLQKILEQQNPERYGRRDPFGLGL